MTTDSCIVLGAWNGQPLARAQPAAGAGDRPHRLGQDHHHDAAHPVCRLARERRRLGLQGRHGRRQRCCARALRRRHRARPRQERRPPLQPADGGAARSASGARLPACRPHPHRGREGGALAQRRLLLPHRRLRLSAHRRSGFREVAGRRPPAHPARRRRADLDAGGGCPSDRPARRPGAVGQERRRRNRTLRTRTARRTPRPARAVEAVRSTRACITASRSTSPPRCCWPSSRIPSSTPRPPPATSRFPIWWPASGR